MNSIEKIAKEVPATSIDRLSKDIQSPYNGLIKDLEKSLSFEEREKFQAGIVGQGLKSQTHNTLVKDFLYTVIESFEYIKGDDSKTRLINGKVKKDLKHHVDYIFDMLISSDTKLDNTLIYYLLGSIITSLKNRN